MRTLAAGLPRFFLGSAGVEDVAASVDAAADFLFFDPLGLPLPLFTGTASAGAGSKSAVGADSAQLELNVGTHHFQWSREQIPRVVWAQPRLLQQCPTF